MLLRLDEKGQRYQYDGEEESASKHRLAIALAASVSTNFAGMIVVWRVVSVRVSSLFDPGHVVRQRSVEELRAPARRREPSVSVETPLARTWLA